MTIAIRFHFGHLDQMPRCAVCGRVVCHHSDLEFAGLVPATQSAATIPGGSGGAGTSLPRPNASALDHQSSDDRFDQFANLNRTFHGGGIR